MSRKPEVLIITGDIQQGKTTLLEAIINDLKNHHMQVHGFLSKVVKIHNERQGYRLVSVLDNRTKTLCSVFPETGSIQYGRFYFDLQAFEFGIKLLNDALEVNADLIVIDEIGPLELRGRGWAPAIANLCNNSAIPMVWVVRRSAVEKTAREWNVGKVSIVDIAEENAGDLIANMIKALAAHNSQRSPATRSIEEEAPS